MIAGAHTAAAHMVDQSRVSAPRRFSSSTFAPIRIAPVRRLGWPSAMAPPFTLTFLRVEPQVADDISRDHGEGFVDLQRSCR